MRLRPATRALPAPPAPLAPSPGGANVDPGRFSGTVIVEPLNPSSGYDIANVWERSWPYFVRHSSAHETQIGAEAGSSMAQGRSLSRSPGCNVAGFSRGFRCSSVARPIPVFTAIEPNESPGRTVQNRGPRGLGRGGGGCRHRLRRCPTMRPCTLTSWLYASSCSTLRPVLAEISARVSPRRTDQ
jgi:Alpha/beta hydrolase domain